MGVGKSTVGALLAAYLGWKFVDLDDQVVTLTGLSIPEIFSQQGETGFRSYEEACLRDVMGSLTGVVLSLGGGTVERQANRQLLQGHVVIWLDGDPEVLFGRADTIERPLTRLGLPEFLKRHRQREPLFREIATHRIDVTTKWPDDIVREIAGWRY